MSISNLSPYFPVFLSLSLSFFFYFILPTFVNLFYNTSNNHTNHHLHYSFLGFSGGLGLITAITHVIVKKPPSSCPPKKKDPAAVVGVLDGISGGAPAMVDGLASCTESLGFESSDQTRLDDPIEKVGNDGDNDDDDDVDDDSGWRKTAAEGLGNWRSVGNRVRKEVKSFPPPLSSLNLNGQPSFFLRPVRKDGRLELTEVRIHRPEILHVWRHDGRLTLHLIPDPDERTLDDSEDDAEEEQEKEQERELEQEEELAEQEGQIGELEEQIVEPITEDEEEEEEEEEDFGFGEWKFGMGGNEGLRRCHEAVNDHRCHVHGSHHHHYHHHHNHNHNHNHNHPLHMCGAGIA